MTWERRVTVIGSSGHRYTVAVRADTGAWGCDCPAWKFKKADAQGNRPDCKHITALKDAAPNWRAMMTTTEVAREPGRFAALDVKRRAVKEVEGLNVGSRFSSLDFSMEVTQ